MHGAVACSPRGSLGHRAPAGLTPAQACVAAEAPCAGDCHLSWGAWGPLASPHLGSNASGRRVAKWTCRRLSGDCRPGCPRAGSEHGGLGRASSPSGCPDPGSWKGHRNPALGPVSPLPRGAASRLSRDARWGLLSIQVPGLQPWGPEETESWARLPAPLPGLASG